MGVAVIEKRQGSLRGFRTVLAMAAVSALVAACGSSSTKAGSTASAPSNTTSAPSNTSTPTAGGSSVSGAPIVIGNIGSYTFPGLAITTPGAAPIKAWASWVNAHGGVNGHPLQLIVKDDQGNQALAVSDVQEMVAQDHIVALVSAQDAPLYLGYLKYLDEMKIPVLGGNVYTDDWATNPMLFPQGFTNQNSSLAQVTLDKSLGLTKVGIIGCSGAVQCTLEAPTLRTLATAAGLHFAYGANPSNTAPDYTANCLAAQSSGAQVLTLGIATADEGNKIAQDCARQGYHPAWIVGGAAIGPGYLNASFNHTYNFSDTQPWYSTAAVMNDFHAAMNQYTKINFNTVEEPLLATDAWASGLMFQKAVQLSGVTGAPTSADIVAGLQKFQNETLGGFVGPDTFTNPANKIGKCFFVTEINNVKFVQVNKGTYLCNP
jgi:branched-chain amino acid transport system substrate-binding protein